MDNATHVDSWYAASAARSTDYPGLRGDTRVDVCVLGAGITGLSTAIHLAEQGYKVAVLEARRVGWGASGRSGGQMIFGFASDQSKLVRLVGSQDARWCHQSVRHDHVVRRVTLAGGTERAPVRPGFIARFQV